MGIEPTSRRVNDDSTALKAAGLESQVSRSQALSEIADTNVTKNDTKRGRFTPELELIARAWPELPQAVRAGIVAMIKASMELPDW